MLAAPSYVRPAPLISLTNSLSCLESPLCARPWGRTDGRPAAWEREVVVVAAVGGVRSLEGGLGGRIGGANRRGRWWETRWRRGTRRCARRNLSLRGRRGWTGRTLTGPRR
ncbi:hypothetical protein GQ55_9G618900 [Panicum hallii var. hallii]|uniref:Uncharacterized protein n=1 Tax=Panicum hallii var. hallii TaxID=1504633 RepID=A0A2T7CI23_9POAL|nr:hypothetical protein GQ55_9G618900 [Panicum hallii var. hallii]